MGAEMVAPDIWAVQLGQRDAIPCLSTDSARLSRGFPDKFSQLPRAKVGFAGTTTEIMSVDSLIADLVGR